MKCLLIEPSEIVRAGLTSILTRNGYDVIEDTYSGLTHHELDLAIIGISHDETIPVVEALKDLKNSRLGMKVFVVSADPNLEEYQNLSRLGVLGYSSQEITTEVLLLGISAILSGASFISPKARKRLMEKKNTHEIKDVKLSTREQEILKALAAGENPQTISARLNTSVEAVKVHAKNILKKMSAAEKAQTALRVLKADLRDIISDPDKER
ncbi:MAG: response regulator transcription factor [Candidatus Obscuribacterales bacterium]|nr:response regulator transcription factor [Candidatus Obscuribacterales bacterium]